jgi:shikimate dehydrogenase
LLGSPSANPRLGVVGWPVGHSRSPAIHNAALMALGLSAWRYQLLPVPPELFSETVKALPAAGFRGVNVTIPHKQAALALADEATVTARAIGAANTLTFDERGAIRAENTDAPALIGALPFDVVGATALVLGAGGSARAAVWALGDAGAREVRVWNRTAQRARRLCDELGATPTREGAPADLLVNCTSVGLEPTAPTFEQLPVSAEQLSRYGCLVDLVYVDGGTPLALAARARGVPVIDGLELLVGQGALSFELFTGLAAPIIEMRAASRRA